MSNNTSYSVALVYNIKPAGTLEHGYTDDDRYAEWDTQETIDAVRDALSVRHKVTLIEADENAYSRLQSLRPDIVFNIAEGLHGVSREAHIPAMCEFLNLPFTGSDTLTLASCLDKYRTKEILSYNGVATARFALLSSEKDTEKINLRYPLMVKPYSEGSGKGIFNNSIVHSAAELKERVAETVQKYNQPALVEEFLPGREFTVAVLGNGAEARVLPLIEINFDALPEDAPKIYSYEAKWIYDSKDHQLEMYHCPAPVSSELEEKITSVTLAAYHTMRCRDWSRLDIRLDSDGEPNIIEINPLPGILPDPKENSCYPKAARTAGMDYNTMILSVLDAALKRYGM